MHDAQLTRDVVFVLDLLSFYRYCERCVFEASVCICRCLSVLVMFTCGVCQGYLSFNNYKMSVQSVPIHPLSFYLKDYTWKGLVGCGGGGAAAAAGAGAAG